MKYHPLDEEDDPVSISLRDLQELESDLVEDFELTKEEAKTAIKKALKLL